MDAAGGSHADPAVREARRKFASALESNVLDYLHYAPAALEACVTTMENIFKRVLDNPEDEKFKKVKIASKTYQDHIAAVRHAEELMLQAGWRPQVFDLQRFMVFEGAPGSTAWAVLGEAREVLEGARETLHTKAERKRIEREEKLKHDSEERHKILAAIEADRADRADRIKRDQEAAAAAAAAASPSPRSPRVGAGPPGGRRVGGGSGSGGSPGADS